MKVKYKGKSFGIEGLTNDKIYECLSIENEMLRIIDDSNEDYLYSIIRPSSLENINLYGKWEIVEDNENKDLKKAINKIIEKMLLKTKDLNEFSVIIAENNVNTISSFSKKVIEHYNRIGSKHSVKEHVDLRKK